MFYWLLAPNYGNMRFSCLRPGQTIVEYETNSGTRDKVGDTQESIEFGGDRFTMNAATEFWVQTVIRFLSSIVHMSFYFVSSSRIQVIILNWFVCFLAQTTCCVVRTCLSGTRSLRIHSREEYSPKKRELQPVFGFCRFAVEAVSAKEPLRVTHPQTSR